MKVSLNNSQSIFRGNVFVTTPISKKAKKTQKFLADILEQKQDGKSFKDIIKKMPFDAYISCKNPTKKAINPILTVFLEKKENKKQVGLYSVTHLKFNQPNEIKRMHSRLYEFAKACEENKNKQPLTRAEASETIGRVIFQEIYKTTYV